MNPDTDIESGPDPSPAFIAQLYNDMEVERQANIESNVGVSSFDAAREYMGVITAQVDEALQGYVGQLNTPYTRARMEHAVRDVMMRNGAPEDAVVLDIAVNVPIPANNIEFVVGAPGPQGPQGVQGEPGMMGPPGRDAVIPTTSYDEAAGYVWATTGTDAGGSIGLGASDRTTPIRATDVWYAPTSNGYSVPTQLTEDQINQMIEARITERLAALEKAKEPKPAVAIIPADGVGSRRLPV